MDKAQAVLLGEKVFSNSKTSFEILERSEFGEKKNNKIFYMNEEAMFLVDEGKIEILSSRYKVLDKEDVLRRMIKIDKRFFVKYSVFRDLRKKGYIVKSGLKFGSDFRVYEKGVKVGRGHSKWICFCEGDNKSFNWQEFSSKNRVAHSTKKKLLIAVVDSEGDVSYYESNWKKII